MMFLGLFTLVVLPLFLIVSARMIYKGEGDTVARRVGAYILYFCAIVTIATGISLVYVAITR